MQSTKKFIHPIKNLGYALTIVTGLTLSLTSESALASIERQTREITRIEWESGEPMNCNGKGVDFFALGASLHPKYSQIIFKNLAVACLENNQENQADWVILGGVTYVAQNNREGIFLERFNPETTNLGNQPNLYSFAKFVIGYNCRHLSGKWECQEYSSTIENNILKTFGLQELESSTGFIPFHFKDLESSEYHTTNEQ